MTKTNRTSRPGRADRPSKKWERPSKKNDRCLGRLSNAETTA